MRKALSGLMLTLLATHTIALALNVPLVRGLQTIFIKPDGSIDPVSATIKSYNNITYTFSGDIFDVSIVVLRDNIVIDGNGHAIKGLGGEDPDVLDGNGILLSERNNVTIRNIVITGFGYGIYFAQSRNMTISGSNITTNFCGLHMHKSSDNIVSRNNITNNIGHGVDMLMFSDNNTFTENRIAYNYYGFQASDSSYAVLKTNSIFGNHWNIGFRGETLSHFLNEVDISNTIDGKPAYYLINKQGHVIDNLTYPNIGYLAVVNSTNITVQNLNMERNGEGVLLAHTRDSLVRNVTAKDNFSGIALSGALNNIVAGNSIIENFEGLSISEQSSYNIINENDIAGNNYGVYVYYSHHNTFSRNDVSDNDFGISLYCSGHNILSQNTVGSSLFFGFGVKGESLDHFLNSIDNSNLVNGNPVYYFVNQTNLIISPSTHVRIGYLALINCRNASVRDLMLKKNFQGLLLAYTRNSTITGNNIRQCDRGVVFQSSDNNTFSGNTLLSSIELAKSSNNTIFCNNFMGTLYQTHQLYVYHSSNVWDVGYPSGGNYWSDYNGLDMYSGPYQNRTGSDGIGDTPYRIDADNQDRYPLMKPIDSTAPITFDDYDDLWHATDFVITLNASDDISGIAETCYKINNGPIQNLNEHGHPSITTESAYNTLEYWSIDKNGNEELPHVLSGIKLDKTAPVANAGGNRKVNVGAIVDFDAENSTDNIGIVDFEWDFGDGATGTAEATTHIYGTAGTYTATLTVEDAAKNIAMDRVTIVVVSAEVLPVWIAGLAIVVVTLATVFVAVTLWKRRK